MLVQPIGPRIDTLLGTLWDAGGTDLLLTAGLPPQLRVHGELSSAAGHPVLTPKAVDDLLAEVLNENQSALWAQRREFDFAFSWRETARIRANAYTQRGSSALALRVIPFAVPSMETLGLPPVLRSFLRNQQGLILVTGPTGSGKSTTLASMINQLAMDRACHIITIEDPIEYVHAHCKAAIDQREVGTDTDSFASALRAALREDPDILLVGEMRDLESIAFALTIAETGHLVFATLHTNDTAQAVSRIIDVFPPEQQSQVRVQLAAALTGIVYQRLLPRVGGGLIAAFEVLVATPSVRNLIKEAKTHQLRNSLLTGGQDGMLTLEKSLSALVTGGHVSYDDAITRSLYPNDVEMRPRPRRVMT